MKGTASLSLPDRNNCIRPPREGNPLYPLPPNYSDDPRKMSPEEAGYWRVNACCIQETPEDFVLAYQSFISFYLAPEEACYFSNYRDTPPAIYQFVHDIAAYKLNSFAAPRYFRKTTVKEILTMLLVLTRRHYRVGWVSSTQDKGRESVGHVKEQLEENPLILADFGQIAPKRGGKTWNSDHLKLNAPFKGNEIRSMWLKGAGRGFHCETIFIDDAEKDPDNEEAVPEYVAKLEILVRKKFMPMVELAPADLSKPQIGRTGTGIVLMGTKIQENMLLSRIVTAEPGGEWDVWNKWDLAQSSDQGLLDAERYNEDSLTLMREIYGDDAYDSEFLGRAGASTSGSFYIDNAKHGYRVEDDGKFATEPLGSDGIVKWMEHDPAAKRWCTARMAIAAEHFGAMARAIIVDSADFTKVSKTSDYSAVHVLGNDARSHIWSLDIHVGRYNEDALIALIVAQAIKWRVRIIAMEAIGPYAKLTDTLFMMVNKQLMDTIGWVPIPLPLNYESERVLSKGQRIDRCSGRFALGMIHFPTDRRTQNGYPTLWDQIAKFTPRLTKLKYDDAVDTLGAIPYVFRGPSFMGIPVESLQGSGLPVVKLIERGILYSESGGYLPDMLPSYSELTDEAIRVMQAAGQDERSRTGNRKRALPRAPARVLNV